MGEARTSAGEGERERCLLESFAAAAAGEASLGALFWGFGDSSRLVECEEGIEFNLEYSEMFCKV